MDELPHNYHLSHLKWALQHVDRFDVAVDGGAHQGIWTREMLKSFRQVIAFEPVASNRSRIPNEATVYPYALGNKNANVSMVPGPRNTGQYHVATGYTHNMVTLDSVVTSCDFLKLDLEGYEMFALLGAVNLIENSSPVIMLELNGLSKNYGIDTMQPDVFLKGMNYKRVGNVGRDYLYKR